MGADGHYNGLIVIIAVARVARVNDRSLSGRYCRQESRL
jgi:hypothetical protein